MPDPRPVIVSEVDVPEYVLPDALVMTDGTPVTDAESWTAQRRPELLKLFEEHVFGRMPEPLAVRSDIVEESSGALAGRATRRQIRISFGQGDQPQSMMLLLYLPKGSTNVPVFLGLNFQGNHTIQSDPAILLPTSWVRGHDDHRASDADRGCSASRWPVARIIERGFGVATIYYGDLDPDYHDSFANGIHPLMDGDAPRDEGSWGAIGAWSWGLSRALDVLQTLPEVAGDRVAVMGHSRLGKTALWAGATDQRFKLVISNNSGCGGAALSRRRFGETIAAITTTFPHWFCGRFTDYADREDQLPIDQHELIALIAPRPVYIASAEDDSWADPHGEFLSARHAGNVYQLLGQAPLPATEQPDIHRPVQGQIAYHIRAGEHGVTDYDWEQFMSFADKYLWQ